MELKKLIGEATEYDKKEMLEEKNPRSWMKSVSAFANGVGGVLIFGIEDQTDKVVGLPDAKGDSEKISRFLRDRMDPIPPFRLRFKSIAGKQLILLEVSAGPEPPYFYVGKNERTAYHRVGNESVICDAAKIRELSLKGSGKTFDSLPSGYDFARMAFTKLISSYYQGTHKDLMETDYISFGIVDSNGNLTNAGALLADNCPIYHSRVFCTRWNGLTKASGLQDAVDDAEYSGSLVSLLQESEAFVKRNSHKGWFKEPDRRVELPDYPERSVTEGIVNALIHRDYMIIGSEVHIDMYDDRLEIYSPGGMYDGIPVQERDILTVPSRRRNPIIADVFSRLGFMERRGSGFKKIIQDYQSQRNYTDGLAPVFKSEYGSFFLTLKNLNYYQGSNQGSNQGSKQGSNQERIDWENRKNAVLALIRTDDRISTRTIQETLGLTERQLSRTIKQLKDEGRLNREGSSRNGHWKTND